MQTLTRSWNSRTMCAPWFTLGQWCRRFCHSDFSTCSIREFENFSTNAHSRACAVGIDAQLDLCRRAKETLDRAQPRSDHPPSLGLEPIGTPRSNHSLTTEKTICAFQVCRSPTMMQTAGYHANQVPQLRARSSQQPSTESIRASVAQLLSQAHNLPCSKVAQAFAQLLPHISRFQLALDALLPSLDEGNEVCGCFYCSFSRSPP